MNAWILPGWKRDSREAFIRIRRGQEAPRTCPFPTGRLGSSKEKNTNEKCCSSYRHMRCRCLVDVCLPVATSVRADVLPLKTE
jgi:hypothetical protein